MKLLFSKAGLKLLLALLALIVVWMLWSAATKLFWIAVFAIIAFIVVKVALKLRPGR